MSVPLNLPEDEAQALYRHLHQLPGGQEIYCELYLQLQNHFFRTLSVEALRALLESTP